MHELVRLYAAERAADLPAADRESALVRLVDFVVHTAVRGSRLLSPHRPPPDVELPPDRTHHPLADAATALRWFTAGHANLLAVQAIAAEHHRHDAVWLLAWALTPFHRLRGWREADMDVWRAALTAAAHLDRRALAYAHHSLGSALSRIGEQTAALEHLQPALALAEECGDLVKTAHAHYIIAVTWDRLGEYTIALEHAMRGLHVFESVDRPVSKAHALNLVGWISAHMGRHADARGPCLAALALFTDQHDSSGQADSLGSLGLVARAVGDTELAVEYYERAIALYREVGDDYSEVRTLDQLANTYATMGRRTDAATIWHRALRLYQEHRRTDDVERVRERLADLHRPVLG
jgi:tetratricopeptide (TPR) repeat protein